MNFHTIPSFFIKIFFSLLTETKRQVYFTPPKSPIHEELFYNRVGGR